MKKKNLRSLKLNKTAVYSFNNVKGGAPQSDRLCSGSCPTNSLQMSDCLKCAGTLDGKSKCLIVCI